MFYSIKECRSCGGPSTGTYCQPCIDEDTRMTDAWERDYARRCEREDDYDPRECTGASIVAVIKAHFGELFKKEPQIDEHPDA